jgi:hypothetical protein
MVARGNSTKHKRRHRFVRPRNRYQPLRGPLLLTENILAGVIQAYNSQKMDFQQVQSLEK